MKGITGNPALEAYQRASVQPVSSTPRPESAPEGTPARQVTQAAKVTISKEARALATEEEAPINSQKVEALRDSIRAGTFHVDSKQIAEELLDDLE